MPFDEFDDWVDDPPADGGDTTVDDGWTVNDDGTMTSPDGDVFDLQGNYLGAWNDDNTFTDAEGKIFDEIGTQVGYDNGDGTWTAMDGTVYNDDNTPVDGAGGSINWTDQDWEQWGFQQDATSGLWYDPLTQTWYTETGEVSGLIPRDLPGGSTSDPGTTPTPLDTSEGFFGKVGDFFSKLLGGSGGSGNLSPGAQSQAQQRAQSAQEKLNQAQQQNASAAQLQALQRQLAIAQAAAVKASGGLDTKTILIALGAAAGVYALTRNRSR